MAITIINASGIHQRIALARMRLKPANILLLDEPIAHLDEMAEARLMRIIGQQICGRTNFMAPHSLRLFSIAHRIIRLETGS
jgi:ABC-type transport system involved in cytochrome bd biosynthesis fused ATPase/permease subunit